MPKPIKLRKKWVIAVKSSGERIAVEDNGGGVYTFWAYTLYGPVGERGRPLPGISVTLPRDKKDRQLIEIAGTLFNKAMKSQVSMVFAMRAQREYA